MYTVESVKSVDGEEEVIEAIIESPLVFVEETVELVDKAVAGVFVADTRLPPEALMLADEAGVVGSVTMAGAVALVDAVAEGSVTEAVMFADNAGAPAAVAKWLVSEAAPLVGKTTVLVAEVTGVPEAVALVGETTALVAEVAGSMLPTAAEVLAVPLDAVFPVRGSLNAALLASQNLRAEILGEYASVA